MTESAKRSAAMAKRVRPPPIPQDLILLASKNATTLPTPPASASATAASKVHSTNLNPAAVISIQTKIRVYSTEKEKGADYPKPRPYLDFVNVNGIQKPSGNKSKKSSETVPSTGGTEIKRPRKPQKVPGHIEPTKIGGHARPKQGVPSSSSSPAPHSFDLDINRETPTESPANLADFGSSPTALSFTFEFDEDGTADIIPHNSCLLLGDSSQGEAKPEQYTQERIIQLRSPLKRTGSHKQNRSGGFFVQSPETGTFEPVLLTPGRSG